MKSIQFTSPDPRISLVTFCWCYQSFSYMEHQNLPTMLQCQRLPWRHSIPMVYPKVEQCTKRTSVRLVWRTIMLSFAEIASLNICFSLKYSTSGLLIWLSEISNLGDTSKISMTLKIIFQGAVVRIFVEKAMRYSIINMRLISNEANFIGIWNC